MDDFTVVSWPDEFIIVDDNDDWTIYTTTDTQYTLSFATVGLNDAAIAAAAAATATNAANTASALLATMAGGFTGQILIKASNLDYAFGWANPTGMLTAIYDPQNKMADAFARANHTGTQLVATISDFSTAADARITAKIGVTLQGYTAILAATTASYTVALDTKLGGIAAQADVTVSALPVAIHGAASKATPVDADEFGLIDSAAAFGLKKWTWANVKAAMLSYWNGTAKAVPVDADRVWQGDSTTANTPVYSTWTQIKAFLKTYFDTLYATSATVATQIAAYAFSVAAKTTLVGADTVNITDSAAGNADKKITWTNMLEQIRVFFMGVNKVTPVDADIVVTGDSAATFAPKYSTWTQIKAFLKTYFDTLYQAIDAQLSSLVRQNSQSAAYQLVLADGGKHIYHPPTDVTARIWTIPANATVAFPIGTVVTFDNDIGAGVITIVITTDTLVLVGAAGSTGPRTLASGGQATALKVSATRWRISGIGLT
jgi:LysM repeat protein